MKNIPLLLGTIIGTIVLVVGIAFFFSKPEQPVTANQDLLMKNARNIKGPENAKVTIVEFSDFQCPACYSVQPLVKQVLAKYPNDVRFIYRHYPIVDIHAHAQQAAEASEVAATFNKFWELHDMFFETQKEWERLDDKGFNEKLDSFLDKLQIDKTEFRKRIESQEVRDRVKTDVRDGDQLKISGTPTFFVNNQMTAAPQLLSTVESLLK